VVVGWALGVYLGSSAALTVLVWGLFYVKQRWSLWERGNKVRMWPRGGRKG
jgi:hypothetical protein